MKKKIFVCDLDGSLLNSEYDLSSLSKYAIAKVIENDDILIFASGRIVNEMKCIYQKIKCTVPSVGSNGAYISDKNGKLLKQLNLPNNIAYQLLKLRNLYQAELPVHIHSNGNWFLEKIDYVARQYQTVTNFLPTVITDITTLTNFNKVYFLDIENKYDLAGFEQIIREKYQDQAYITFTSNDCLEIMHKQANKADGLSFLLNHLGGYLLSDAIVFGDSLNDFAMLSQAKLGVVMQNANAKLKSLLKDRKNILFSPLSNDQDAVANVILSYY